MDKLLGLSLEMYEKIVQLKVTLKEKKMEIEIKSRFTGRILIQGDYKNVKECLVRNSGADLGGADLRDADLRDAYLGGADLRDADLRDAALSGAYLRDADLSGADLRDAYLGGADLRDADLRDADLSGAYLGGADLRGAEGYRDSHDFFTEIVRRQPVKVFATAEWEAIAQITIHRLCWDSIKKRFSEVMPHIFQILAEAGFDEWLKHWNTL